MSLELRLEDYDYPLPPELIAQEPLARRADSRLLVVRRDPDGFPFEHRVFADVERYLQPGDLMVLNDTRVIPARLRARRATGGAVEILLLEEQPDRPGAWAALVRPARAGKQGEPLVLEKAGDIEVGVLDRHGKVFRLEFRRDGRALTVDDVIGLCARFGETPLPPYIRRRPEDRHRQDDRERYQTVYARRPGAVAAPTAGLHFTSSLLDRLNAKGVESARVTLHVGLDTFQPLRAAELHSGRLHGERVEISRETGAALRKARREGRRIVAVGTTCVRALESFAAGGFTLPYAERTTLFIRPGHRFQLVDALITNFHLPRSSLLLLVSAFAGRERIFAAYREAIERRYRFYSYGDAMLIL